MLLETRHLSLQEQYSTYIEKTKLWVYEHPTAAKVAQFSQLFFGVGSLVSLPWTASVLGTGIAVSVALIGAVLVISASVALLALDLLVPPHHEMAHHVYKPNQCEGGRLYYEGDVPVLTLESDDPFKAGKAHGYLCGEAINRLSKRFGLVLHTLLRQPRASQIPNTLAEVRKSIPAEHLREIEGLVEGYNQWVKEQHWWQFPNQLSVDDALLFHLIPDSLHFQAGTLEGRLKNVVESNRQLPFGCSAIVDRDPQKGFVFARNMDWPSFGLAGAYSLVVNRKHTNGLRSTVEVGVPGLIGTLTGMNDQGLSIAMNVCSGTTRSIRGMPASLYNRTCLERCQNAQEVEKLTQSQSPLGPYHLTVVDRNQANSIHFYQSNDGHPIRRWEDSKPLSTLNCRYSPQPNSHMHYSVERQQRINAYFQQRENRPIEDVLSLPFINNWITTHTVLMEPQTRTFKVAFDNAFAGRTPLHAVPTQRLFSEG